MSSKTILLTAFSLSLKIARTFLLISYKYFLIISSHALSHSTFLTHWLNGLVLSEISKHGFSDRFEKKYSHEELMFLAFMLPGRVKLTYKGVLQIYPIMSKRHIYEIIDIRKNLYENMKRNFLNHS